VPSALFFESKLLLVLDNMDTERESSRISLIEKKILVLNNKEGKILNLTILSYEPCIIPVSTFSFLNLSGLLWYCFLVPFNCDHIDCIYNCVILSDTGNDIIEVIIISRNNSYSFRERSKTTRIYHLWSGFSK
jgi:hypothetical protein